VKYHIRRRAWTLREEFIVRDQGGASVYKVKGKFFHIGDNLVIHDLATHAEVAHIKQKVLHVTPHYEIYRDGAHWASMHEKLLHLFGERFKIKLENGTNYHIEGNIWNWDFTVTNDRGDLIAQIGERLSLLRDYYAVEIAQGVDVPFIIALAIVIEMIREHQSEKDKE
jgi:uncharacterized protein YxjI